MASQDIDSDDNVPDDDFFRSIEGRYLAELDRHLLGNNSNNDNNDHNDNNNNNNVAGASAPACKAVGPGREQQRRREAFECQESAQAASTATSVSVDHIVSPPTPPGLTYKQELSLGDNIQCYGLERQQLHQQYLQQQLQHQQQQQQQQQQHALHVLQQYTLWQEQQQQQQQRQQHALHVLQQYTLQQYTLWQEQQQQQLCVATFRTGTSVVIAPDPGCQKALADKSEALVARSSDSSFPGLQVGTAVVNRNNDNKKPDNNRHNNSSSSNRTPAGDFGTWTLDDAQPSDEQRSHLLAKLLEDGRPSMVEQATLGQESLCFLKILVPDLIAVEIMGKRLSIIGDTRCSLQVSRAGSFFPGTRLRTLLLWGVEITDLSQCVRRVLQFDVGREQESLLQCDMGEEHVLLQEEYANWHVRGTIVVPSSSVCSIIGRNGRLVWKLMAETGCIIQVSQRHSQMKEQLIAIVGKHTVAEAAISICSTLQKDAHLEQHLNLEYDVWIPMGSWPLAPRRRSTSQRVLQAVCRGGQGPSQSEASDFQTSATAAPPGPLPPSDFVAAP
ncbi:unnamed protein product [Polarella glacialis]|uniref:K Homology domain-containing protein n=1 Tax=Polarella glacialis TaxID=89957 RepID=A0A813LJX2_POLGL|nr:unnamed protein product [Polarella glacialis]CAE8731581.1 unnamed protein product [Polarella glacialis]